jgi:hypothetical protein
VTLLAWVLGDWRAKAITGCQDAIIVLGYVCVYGSCRGPLLGQALTRWLIEDVALMVVCLVSAWRAERYWPLWASSCALLLLVTDVMMLVEPRITFWADLSASYVWKILLTISVLYGVWQRVRAKRRLSAAQRQ